jgi:hypothetical protein
VVTRYHILETSGLPAVESEGDAVRAFEPEVDLSHATTLDRAASGEDRGHLLRAMADSTRSLALHDPRGDLRAFLIRPPWTGGAVVASDVEWGARLLDARRRRGSGDRRLRAGLLAENHAGRERLVELGWSEAWSAIRMERGPAVATRPEMLYGQFNFALG